LPLYPTEPRSRGVVGARCFPRGGDSGTLGPWAIAGRILRPPRPRTLPRPEMPLNIPIDGDVAILSNFARLMNDPRYVDAQQDLRDLLDQGYRKFVLDLSGARETGPSFLGLLMTLTRQVEHDRGEAVLANLSREMQRYLGEMQMEDYWEVFASVQEATEFLRRRSA